MIRSMTGYGRARCEIGQKTVTAEIKSLNSKYFDLNIRIAHSYKEKEMEIRNLLISEISRGKAEINLSVDWKADAQSEQINESLFHSYMATLQSMVKPYSIQNDVLFASVMKMPNVIVPPKEDLSDAEWKIVKTCIESALENFTEFRIREGQEMKKDFLQRIETIFNELESIELKDSQRIQRKRDRLNQQLQGWALPENIDQNRLEQEIIYFLEKLDITEEKVRLKSHLDYFRKLVSESELQKGKKLGFVCQEIGREVNTIGSKSNDAELQKHVVHMKDELEKIKEQLLNIL